MQTHHLIVRGTTIVLIKGANGAIAGDIGKVASRKKNGWLRVTIERTGNTISIRNNRDIGIKTLDNPNPVKEPPNPVKEPPNTVDNGVECKEVELLSSHQYILHLESEIKKRDKWLERAIDIIKEYQKRHSNSSSARGRRKEAKYNTVVMDGGFEYAVNRW
jgi:hypothetical protein